MSDIDVTLSTDPRTREDLLRALAYVNAREMAFWRSIDAERFARPFGDAWSPADNVRHLVKSTTPLIRALKLPRLALWVLFGQGGGTSVGYADLVERYRGVLAAGGKAGRFAPSPERPPADLRGWQRDLVAQFDSAVRALACALEPWREHDLDLCRLPHPLLGTLTVREMMLFTVYHYEHHRTGVARRLAGGD